MMAARLAASLRRWSAILAPVGVACGFMILGLHKRLTFEPPGDHRTTLPAFAEVHPVAAPVVLAFVYVAVVSCLPPDGTILTISCGFPFGLTWGTPLAAASTITGATILFMFASTSLAPDGEHGQAAGSNGSRPDFDAMLSHTSSRGDPLHSSRSLS